MRLALCLYYFKVLNFLIKFSNTDLWFVSFGDFFRYDTDMNAESELVVGAEKPHNSVFDVISSGEQLEGARSSKSVSGLVEDNLGRPVPQYPDPKVAQRLHFWCPWMRADTFHIVAAASQAMSAQAP